MLTTIHKQYLPHLTNLHARREYAQHMCGLCHSLGDHYGLLSRLATSHEMILLNLLTSAQMTGETTSVTRRCPLNPLLKVSTNHGVASEFASAVAIMLAGVKFMDDIQDSNDWDAIARLGHKLTQHPRRIASQILVGLGFDDRLLQDLSERQAKVESEDAQDATAPSALVSSELFAMTARIANLPENEELLASIGANFGAYVYLMDAYQDLPRDMQGGNYNPLRRFCEESSKGLMLSQTGLRWLLSRFEKIQASIRETLPRVQLHRHRALLEGILCDSMDGIVSELSKRVKQSTLIFRRFAWADILKAGFFILPAETAATGFPLTGSVIAHKIESPSEEDKFRRRSSSCDFMDPLCWCSDCGHCVHCGSGLGDCASSSSGFDCSGMDCSGVDCGAMDCSGMDCLCSGCN